jgi:uncharacterized membrane protein
MTMAQEHQRPRPRIESLTDLIFGLALSIGAVGLLNNKPTGIADLILSVSLFLFSFLILISIWLRYTETMSVLPVETSGTRILNVFLLFFVALEPYLFNLIGSQSFSTDVATVAYALDIGAIYAILASFNGILSSQERKLVAPPLMRKYHTTRNLQILVAGIFWISAFPPFFTIGLMIGGQTTPLRFFLWALTFVFSRGTWVMKRAGKL